MKMSKLVIMAALAVAAATAGATEIGMRYGSNSNTETESTGITLNQQFGTVGAELSYDRALTNAQNDRYMALATYDITKFGDMTLTAKGGAAYIDGTNGVNGYAGVLGAGVSYPVTKTVKLVADYRYQFGQERVNAFNGNSVSVGVKFAF